MEDQKKSREQVLEEQVEELRKENEQLRKDNERFEEWWRIWNLLKALSPFLQSLT